MQPIIRAYHAEKDDEGDVRLLVNSNEPWTGPGSVYRSELLVNNAADLLEALQALSTAPWSDDLTDTELRQIYDCCRSTAIVAVNKALGTEG